MVILSETKRASRTLTRSLESMIPAPAELPGWQCEVLPVADTLEMKKAMTELLNYDDGIFVVFTRGTVRIRVYVAYWSPGRMAQRLVAGHTPDTCWIGAGWYCLRRSTNADLALGSGPRLLPAQQREMSMDGQTETVVFWHVVDGRVSPYADSATPPWHAMVTDLWTDGLQQCEEQYFVRLSSPSALDQWWGAEPVQKLLSNLVVLHVRGK